MCPVLLQKLDVTLEVNKLQSLAQNLEFLRRIELKIRLPGVYRAFHWIDRVDCFNLGNVAKTEELNRCVVDKTSKREWDDVLPYIFIDYPMLKKNKQLFTAHISCCTEGEHCFWHVHVGRWYCSHSKIEEKGAKLSNVMPWAMETRQWHINKTWNVSVLLEVKDVTILRQRLPLEIWCHYNKGRRAVSQSKPISKVCVRTDVVESQWYGM